MGKGSDWERKLVRRLDRGGWGVLRSGGSGGGTDDDRPDFVAGDGSRFWVVEAKYCSDPLIYLEPEEVAQILVLAEAFGGTPIIAARWNANQVDGVEAEWYLFDPRQLPRTDSGNYAVRVSDLGGHEVLLSEVTDL